MPAPDLGTLAAPVPGSAGPDAQPVGAGSATPPDATASAQPAGRLALSKMQVASSMDLLTRALVGLKAGSAEHKTVLDVISRLSKQFSGTGAESASSDAAVPAAPAAGAGPVPPAAVASAAPSM